MRSIHVLLVSVLLFAGCAAPTLAQRQANWRLYRNGVMATCEIGKADPAMPIDVDSWCRIVSEP